jgi:hypothetical protein
VLLADLHAAPVAAPPPLAAWPEVGVATF